MNRKRGATIKVPFFPDPAKRNDAHIKLFVQRASPSSWPGRGLRPKSSRMARAEAALHPFFANKKEGAGLAAPGERLVESVSSRNGIWETLELWRETEQRKTIAVALV